VDQQNGSLLQVHYRLALCRNGSRQRSITLERKHDEHTAKLVLKDHDHLSMDDNIGETEINLDPIISSGRATQWYELKHHWKSAGKVLIDIEYIPN